MTLDQVSENQEVVVKNLLGGFGLRRRLHGLGIYPGERLKVLNSALMRGPILLEVRGVEVAIGRGVAGKVEVELWTGKK